VKDITSLRPPRAAHAEPPAHAPNAALLIDFDNVTLAIRSDLSAQLRKLLASDIFKGKVSVQRAYADWRRYPQYIVPLSEASIDLIFAPAFGSNKKNATDIRLAIDALELVFTRPEIGTFILLSGDSDFSSLVLKLKEYGKYVIGVGIRESSSDLLVQNCDEYFSYSELTGLTKQTDLEYPHRDPWELVIEAVTQMKSEGDVMRSDRLKQVMQQLDPSFDEKEAGFSRFSKFVMEAGQRGLLHLNKLENGQYEIDLGSNANVPTSVEVELASGKSRRPARRPTAPRVRERAAGGGGSLTLAGAFRLLRDTLATLGALEEEVEGERVREAMTQHNASGRDPILEPSRFHRLLRQAHDANVVELTKADDGRYFLKLNPEALVEDQVPAEVGADGDAAQGAGGVAGPSPAKGSEAPEGSEETEAEGAGRRRRGRRGGRGRGKGRGHKDEADVATPQPAEQSAEMENAAPVAPRGAPASALTSHSRNPRFRRGSRGVSRAGPSGESPSSGEASKSAPSTPPAASLDVGERHRSLRPRAGSRGGARHQPEAPAKSGTARPVGDSMEPPPQAAAATMRREAMSAPPPEMAAEVPPTDGQPSLLRRVTAALQRAVRGPDGEKPPET
jgi:uncharacterized protein (TIGR00288 family)